MLRMFGGGYLAAAMKKGKNGRVVPGVISTDQLDGHRTIILPSAFEADRAIYESNPVLLWSHDQRIPPLGIGVPDSYKIQKAKVLADYEESGTELSSEIFGLYEREILRGFSVGGYIRKYVGSWQDEKNWEDLPAHARKAMKDGDCYLTCTRFEHRETSACACPSNPGALARALADGFLSEKYAPVLTRGAEFVDLAAEIAELATRQEELLFKLDRVCEALCRKEAEAPVDLVTESVAEDFWQTLKRHVESPRSNTYDNAAFRADLKQILAG